MKKIIISLFTVLISTAAFAEDTPDTTIPPLWDENSPPMSLEQFMDNPENPTPGLVECTYCNDGNNDIPAPEMKEISE